MKPARSPSSLRNSLIIPGAAIMLVLSLGLIGVGYWASNTIVNTMSEQLIRDMTTNIRDHVNIMMDVPSRMLKRVGSSVSLHDIALTDPHALARELYTLLRDEPDVDWLFYANEAGGLVSTGRLENGEQVILLTDGFRAGVVREYNASPDGRITTLRKSAANFDFRLKDWYETAREKMSSAWTKAYIGSVEPILGISLSAPALDKDGKFVGVYGLDLILTRLSEFMGRQRLGSTGRTFLVDDEGFLIASSGGVSPVAVTAEGRQHRLRPADANDPVVRAAAREASRRPEILADPGKADLQVFLFEDPVLGRISTAVQSFQIPNGISWLIVSALPISNFLGAVYQASFLSLGLVALLVVGSLAVGFVTVGRVLRPLYALTDAAHVIAEGGWPDVPETQRNDEIGVLARALDDMTRNLHTAYADLEQRVAVRTRELSEANARLKELDHLKSLFIASMSHELRTPLNSVIGFSSILLDEWLGPLNAEQKDNLDRILRSGRHLLALINDVIDVSRIEAGKIETILEEFDVYDVLVEAVTVVGQDVLEKQLELEIHEDHAHLRADRRRLLQCVLNLVSNAAKFTIRGSLLVHTARSGDFIEISITDTGIGIREEDLPRLYTPFVRLDSPLRSKVAGTGLGLYLTKKLVTEVLKGTLVCHSRYGEGTTFTIKMPMKRGTYENSGS